MNEGQQEQRRRIEIRILASIDRDVTAYLAVRPEATADEIQRVLESPTQVQGGEIPGWEIDDILLLLPALGYVEQESGAWRPAYH